MIIDCHAHYEPRILDDLSILEGLYEAGVDKTVLISHLTDPPETQKGNFTMAVQRFMFDSNFLRPLGIAITKSMYKKSGEWNLWFNKLKKDPQKFNIVQKPDNEGIARIIEKFPDKFLGWIFINPLLPEALDELDRWKDTPGMVGVKIHPFWHRFPMEKVEAVGINPNLVKRSLNEGFSGGEKKRNEMLQLEVLKPTLAVLDETDSGLDVDALRIVAEGVNSMRSPERSFIVVTHYQRLLNYITPDVVHILVNGKIVKAGGAELALEVEKNGYKSYLAAAGANA